MDNNSPDCTLLLDLIINKLRNNTVISIKKSTVLIKIRGDTKTGIVTYVAEASYWSPTSEPLIFQSNTDLIGNRIWRGDTNEWYYTFGLLNISANDNLFKIEFSYQRLQRDSLYFYTDHIPKELNMMIISHLNRDCNNYIEYIKSSDKVVYIDDDWKIQFKYKFKEIFPTVEAINKLLNYNYSELYCDSMFHDVYANPENSWEHQNILRCYKDGMAYVLIIIYMTDKNLYNLIYNYKLHLFFSASTLYNILNQCAVGLSSRNFDRFYRSLEYTTIDDNTIYYSILIILSTDLKHVHGHDLLNFILKLMYDYTDIVTSLICLIFNKIKLECEINPLDYYNNHISTLLMENFRFCRTHGNFHRCEKIRFLCSRVSESKILTAENIFEWGKEMTRI